MNTNDRYGYVAVIIVLVVVGIGAAITQRDQGRAEGEQTERARFQRAAVKDGMAKWGSDEQGNPLFVWTVCTALGVRK